MGVIKIETKEYLIRITYLAVVLTTVIGIIFLVSISYFMGLSHEKCVCNDICTNFYIDKCFNIKNFTYSFIAPAGKNTSSMNKELSIKNISFKPKIIKLRNKNGN